MKTKAIACLFAAAAMTFGTVSFAQGRDGRNDGPPGQQRNDSRPGNQGGNDNNKNNRPGNDNRGPDGRDNRGDNRSDQRADRGNQHSYNARGAEWRRGGRVPQEYRHNTYRVNDWRAHKLSQPPRGHQWVQVGSDYVLMSVATGVIAQLLLSQ